VGLSTSSESMTLRLGLFTIAWGYEQHFDLWICIFRFAAKQF
jgi:hypothetical protein